MTRYYCISFAPFGEQLQMSRRVIARVKSHVILEKVQPKTTRTLKDLAPVLQNPEAVGPSPVYEVFIEPENNEWVNRTVIQPGYLGEEYTKTFGHYHTHPVAELYKVESGEGVLLLQKGTPDIVEEVLLVRAKAGDKILINPEYGHSWSNTGNEELVLLDNWKDGHTPSDYQPIESHAGMSYYIVDQSSKPIPIPNPIYKNLPPPHWINAVELQQ